MNILFRVLLAIYGICLAIIAAVTAVIAVKPQIFDNIFSYIELNVLGSSNRRIIMFLLALIFFVVIIMFLFSGFKSNKDKKSVSKYTNIGEIKISLNSIESIALAASRKLNGIKETKASVIRYDDSVSISIKAVILGDINIPSLSEDIQVKVKNSVEDTTGIKVNDVRVTVENIFTGFKTSRVE
ncbi:MAG: alkaline shock response membrane anchor protein AmaP [Clostridia bacterium]|nr:alkaline shock response membrane anchor protein AmaP [Clostridia bacterium]